MPRWLIVLHRYTGVVIGLLMTLWCLSGVVMMYVGYPALEEKERLAALAPIDWSRCCNLTGAGLADDDTVEGFRLESMAGTPLLRVSRGMGRTTTLDLASGRLVEGVDAAQARVIAASIGTQLRLGLPADIRPVERDQWTVSGAFDRHRPLHLVSYADAAGTRLHLSSATGEVMQDTTRAERFWNWLGAVPHWLYPTVLRQNAPLWSQVVIWTSVVGTFLTVTGLYLGIAQLARRKRTGRWSPYRGLFFWHHVTGLVFGILTLTWVVSGLLSMNPWGLLEGGSNDSARAVRGEQPTWAAVRGAVEALKARPPAGAVSVSVSPLDGKPYLLASDAAGEVQRLDAAAAPARVTLDDLQAAATRAAGPAGIASQRLLSEEDAYYFSHHDTVRLPVYRVILKDAEATRVYIDTTTGRVARVLDSDGRGFRWLHLGLHRLDVFAWLRARPIWDIVVLILLLGVTASVGIGTWMGFQRLARDLRPRRQRPSSPA